MSEDQTLNLSDFAKVIDFNSLYQSYTEARKGKRWKYAVCKYEVNVLENLEFSESFGSMDFLNIDLNSENNSPENRDEFDEDEEK